MAPKKKGPGYRADESPGVTGTELFQPPPPLDATDTQILAALCRPVLGGDAFTPPASAPDIAAAVGLAVSIVEQRIDDLCARFDVESPAHLAVEAIRRGAVQLS
jgi:hypothetical protein